MVADCEALAQLAQRELELKTYLRPIIVGSGAVGFQNRPDTLLAFCPRASSKPNRAGGFTYGFDRNIPAGINLCVHGQDEDDSAYKSPRLAKCEILRLPGGHHFDDDDPRLTALILAAFDRRTSETGSKAAAQSTPSPAAPSH